MAYSKKKSGLSDFERDRMARLKQASMREYSPGLPSTIPDPLNPDRLLPEAPEKYPIEKGGTATGVGADGTTPYSPAFWKKKEKRPPGKSVREEWEEAEQPEEAIPVSRSGQVKKLLHQLRQPQ